MTPAELYDEVASRFSALWPQSSEWEWVNVHDGQVPLPNTISALLERFIVAQDVVVIVRSEPGIAVALPKKNAASYVAGFVLQHEVQVSDPLFTHFVSVAVSGVATGDA